MSAGWHSSVRAMLLIGSHLVCLIGLCYFQPDSAKAESYVAGQFGVLAHGTYNDPDNVVSDLRLKSSVVYGAKLGHYFDDLKYFGV